MLIDTDIAIGKLDPPDLFRRRLVTQIENQMSATMTQRRLLLGTSRDTVSWSLLVAMTAWLVIVFAVFGVIAPLNLVVYVTILLCALSFSSAIFFILEFDTPVDGFIYASRDPLREALRHIDAS
jgi:CHASE2 domain-containing sensor protein